MLRRPPTRIELKQEDKQEVGAVGRLEGWGERGLVKGVWLLAVFSGQEGARYATIPREKR